MEANFSEDNREGLKSALKGEKKKFTTAVEKPVERKFNVTTAVATLQFRWNCKNVKLNDNTEVVVKILQQSFEIFSEEGIKLRDEWRDVPEVVEGQ